jgi:hypothetical protein
MDMRSLQDSLEAIEHLFTPEKPMRNPSRKLLTRTRQEPSSPILEPRSRFPRKSILRSPANYARNMGARILRTLPRTVAGMRKTER